MLNYQRVGILGMYDGFFGMYDGYQKGVFFG